MASVSVAFTFGAFGDIVTAIDLLIKSVRSVLDSKELEKICNDIVNELQSVKSITSQAKIAIESGQIPPDLEKAICWHVGKCHHAISDIQREIDFHRRFHWIVGGVKWAVSGQMRVTGWKAQLAEESSAILLRLQLYQR